jgi:hypothetical protein
MVNQEEECESKSLLLPKRKIMLQLRKSQRSSLCKEGDCCEDLNRLLEEGNSKMQC